MKIPNTVLLILGLTASYSISAESICNERVYLNGTEEEVFAKFPGMVEVSIYSLLARPDEYSGKAITVRGLLASVDAFYVLVPPNAPDARLIPTSSVRINLNKPTNCFFKYNQGELVVVRGRFQPDGNTLRVDDVYYAARLRAEE